MIVWFFLFFSILIVIIDRILKVIIFQNISVGTSFPVINNILHITPLYNKGIAFGLFKETNLYIFITASFVTSIFILYTMLAKRPKSRQLTLGLTLIFSGAVGNLIDRVIHGHVLDFIDIRIWPVFNIADSAITIGASLVLWYLFKNRTNKK